MNALDALRELAISPIFDSKDLTQYYIQIDSLTLPSSRRHKRKETNNIWADEIILTIAGDYKILGL